MLAVRWRPLSMHQWMYSLIEMLSLELSVAKMNEAGQRMLKARKEALDVARGMI